jgi:cell division protein FtsZ
MVRPGLVNLDFADVETIKKGMGKAMMGTGEAEGEKRAEEATNAALNNPLIDEYSLKGAKGLLVNITGGNDLTLFEVDEAVNKIRAEVDPEAELIFGSIEDENLNGKIRVSIVATSLDGQAPQIKPVISMVHRLHNRNIGYTTNQTDTLTSNRATINATEGATALDINIAADQNIIVEEKSTKDEINEPVNDPSLENISMENTAYLQSMENISSDYHPQTNEENMPTFEVDSIELATPELFSNSEEENSFNQDNNEKESEIFESFEPKKEEQIKEPEMFEENNQEEDFEIPAFLRRQKN